MNIEGDIENTIIEIFDTQGKSLVHSEKSANQNIVISLENLNFGIYIVVVKNNQGVILASERIVKK